jgi:hypothetical protein
MTEDEVIQFVRGLPGAVAVTAAPESGAPEVAWGDTFCFHDPADQRFPFATIVVKNYPGFDEASQLDRPGVFRVNVAAGRERFEELFGHRPREHPEHSADDDYTALDRILPHPVYAGQGWISVLNPGPATDDRLRALLTAAHARAVEQGHRGH